MYTKTPKSFSKYIFLDFGKKVIVTIFSTKKRDCEHYGLSDVCIVFFKSKTFFCKMDIYKCPFLKNPKYFWKKRFTSSLRRPPYQSYAGYLSALRGGAPVRDDEIIMLTIRGSQQFCERWGRKWGISFFII